MPYVSKKQEAWAHTPSGEKALGGPSKVSEWDSASKGKDLPVYAKGSKPTEAHYARGGAVQAPGRDFTKTGDGRFQKGDFKKAPDDDNDKTLLPNKRTDQEDGDTRLGTFLGGNDRFTSQNFAEQGDPASMQRIKPDEDWSKTHVKGKNPRAGDDKSEKPVLARGGGKRHSSIQGG